MAHTARFKLVQYPRLEGGYDSRLYDLENDPQESVDVTAEHPDVAAFLRQRLEAWGADVPTAPQRTFDPEVEEHLRALGYLK